MKRGGHERQQLRRNLPHFTPQHVKQSDSNCDEKHADEWRLERLGEVLLQEHQDVS